MEILDLSQVAQSEKEYEKIIRGRLSNEVIAQFYEDMASFVIDEPDEAQKLRNKATNIKNCHKIMHFNHYKENSIKDYQKTLYCHDKFCPLCGKLKANTREKKFVNILTHLDPQYDFYHMILTLKSVRGSIAPWKVIDNTMPELKPYVKTMSKSYKHLTRFLSGNAKIAGIDFSDYGFAGAIRTLETTFKQSQIYHPHYHSIVAMKKGLEFTGKTINTYSHNKFNNEVTPFSDFEILLQKIWYLILNSKKVTTQAIESLPLGYSCMFKKVLPNESHDVFKYIIKPDKDEYLTPDVFQDLYDALKSVKAIQTYGCFRKLHLEDEAIDDTNDESYDHIIQYLNSIEQPTDCGESPTVVRDNIIAKKFLYISRKSVRSFIKHMGCEDDEVSFILSDPKKLHEFVQTVIPNVLNKPSSSLLYLEGGRNIPYKPELKKDDPSTDIF